MTPTPDIHDEAAAGNIRYISLPDLTLKSSYYSSLCCVSDVIVIELPNYIDPNVSQYHCKFCLFIQIYTHSPFSTFSVYSYQMNSVVKQSKGLSRDGSDDIEQVSGNCLGCHTVYSLGLDTEQCKLSKISEEQHIRLVC